MAIKHRLKLRLHGGCKVGGGSSEAESAMAFCFELNHASTLDLGCSITTEFETGNRKTWSNPSENEKSVDTPHSRKQEGEGISPTTNGMMWFFLTLCFVEVC
jgi:hypothetical protein